MARKYTRRAVVGFPALKRDGKKSSKSLTASEKADMAFILECALEIRELQARENELREKKKKASKRISKMFERNNLKAINIEDYWFYNREPKTYYGVDVGKLRDEYPEAFEETKIERVMWSGIYVMSDERREKIKDMLTGKADDDEDDD